MQEKEKKRPTILNKYPWKNESYIELNIRSEMRVNRNRIAIIQQNIDKKIRMELTTVCGR